MGFHIARQTVLWDRMSGDFRYIHSKWPCAFCLKGILFNSRDSDQVQRIFRKVVT